MKPAVIAVVGPTASGKSDLGVFLARAFSGEIISADSRQVYKGLDIATGKITKKDMRGVPHHVLDVASPKRVYSAGDYLADARKALALVVERGHLPIIVGGTGLYVDVLLGRMSLPEVPPNAALRARLEKKSAAQLFAMLQKVDPERAKTIEPMHARRIIRALEIAAALGKNPTPMQESPYTTLWVGINLPEKVLVRNIRQRILSRMKRGMVAEARRLHEAGLSYKRMEALGLEYRLLAQLLRGELTREDFVLQLERETLQYVKRQLRWFKRNQDIHWVSTKTQAKALAKSFLRSSLAQPRRLVATRNSLRK